MGPPQPGAEQESVPQPSKVTDRPSCPIFQSEPVVRTRLLPLALAAATAVSALAFAPASTAPTAADCTDTVGRELLTMDGLSLAVASPAISVPELAATADVTGEALTPHRSAHWFTTIDAAPYDQVKVTATATWADTPSDYDLYAFGYYEDTDLKLNAGTSNESNIDGGDTRSESFSFTATDCERIDFELRAWAGNPAQDVQLEIPLEPVGDASSDVSARALDSRATLYLAGDRPGNITTPADTAGAEYPFHASFSEDRPTSNVPNLTTRVAGSQTEKNPVQPWWAGQADSFPLVQGRPSVTLWLSSATQQQDPGSISVQLFLNGAEQVVIIPGSELTSDVKPFLIEFDEVDTQVYSYGLQVTALPVASPNAASEHTGDANHTVWYDSVQYGSRLFLPIVPFG